MPKTLEKTKCCEPKTIINQKSVNDLLTVMFIDYKCVCKSNDTNDNLAQLDLIKQYDNIITAIIDKDKGVLIKSKGYNKYYYFTGERDSVNLAIEIQNKIEDYNVSRYSETFFLITIGLHTVNCITKKDKNINSALDLLSEIEAIANPGEILLTRNTYDLTTDKSRAFCETTAPSLIENHNKSYYAYKVLWDKNVFEKNKESKDEKIKTFPIYKKIIVMSLVPILVFLILAIGGIIPNLFRFSFGKSSRSLENSTTVNESSPVVK